MKLVNSTEDLDRHVSARPILERIPIHDRIFRIEISLRRSYALRLPRRQVIAFRVRRKGPMLHIFAVVLDRGAEETRRIRIAANEFGGGRKGEIDEIVKDKNLAVAIRSCANSNRRDGQRGSDGCRSSVSARSGKAGLPGRILHLRSI